MDNVILDTGNNTSAPASTTIATDDVSGVHYQKVKPDYGGDGVSVPAKTADLDTGGGTDTVPIVGIALPKSGGAVAGGTSSDPIRTDPTGTTTQPVSGTVTANAGTNLNTSTLAIESGGNLATISSTVKTDDTAFTPATDKVTMVGAEFDDSSPDAVDEGDAGAIRMSANRNLYVRIRDNAGNERGLNIDTNGALAATVTNATASNLNVTEASAASSLTALQLIDDIVYTDDTSTHATGTSKGALFMAAAAPTDVSVNANDIGAVAMTTDRKLHVSVQDALPAGTNAIGKLAANDAVDIGDVTINNASLAVTQATASSLNAQVVGSIAHDAGDSGNPVKVGGKAITALPTAVANSDRADFITDVFGRQLTTHIDAAQQMWKQVEASTTQTGTAIWTPPAGKKIAITSLDITTGGTTAGIVTVWFGASGDTTFTQGTDQVVFRGEFAPSTTSKPGVVMAFPTPRFAITADHILRYTTSANMTVYVNAYGYEV
jgi:hypothetical protein